MNEASHLDVIRVCWGFYPTYFIICADYKVTLYQMTMIKSEKPIETVLNKGARYKEQAKTLISQTDSGDIFIYEKINVTGSDSVSLDLEPIFYRIN